MRQQIEDEWSGWDGDTIVRLTDGSVWRQEEYESGGAKVGHGSGGMIQPRAE